MGGAKEGPHPILSYDQMAELDLPAIVEYVQLTTKQKSIYYLGHSQGALLLLARLARRPDFARSVRRFFALAPVTRVTNLKGPMASVGRLHNAFPVSAHRNDRTYATP